MVLEARRGAGLGQTELARLAEIPIRTLTRVEQGEVVPRIDTVERLLLACGRTLAAAPRIRPIEAPVSSSGTAGPHMGKVHQGLRYLGSARVSSVIVGRLAARLYGAEEVPPGIEVLVADIEDQRTRLVRVLRLLDRRFARAPFFAELTDPKLHWERWMRASPMTTYGRHVRLATLDDLIDGEADAARKAKLSMVREELDAG